MATAIDEIKRTDLFVKSSVDDFQDPVFLTFRIDFFPPEEQYPRFDGITSSNLLKANDSASTMFDQGRINGNQRVEFSTEDWLRQYYPDGTYGANQTTPAQSLSNFKKKLREIQDAPWYFQSIQGIGDLWKAMHRVKEGNQTTSITINCIDSIRQPLTEMAESYRYAIYDQERMSYRVPDNMRWFDMVIDLVEIRDIVDRSGQFFTSSDGSTLDSGLRVVQFRCKMCEFDFSGFFGGSQSDHKVFTEEKPFTPSFNIDIGWVIQEPVELTDANTFRQMGIFSGVLDDMNNKITRFIQTATRLPGAIVGSVINEIQTAVETAVIGNAYSGFNEFLNELNEVSGDITGRAPLVGPPPASNLGTNVYGPRPTDPATGKIGDAYENPPVPTPVSNLGDVYDALPVPLPVNTLGSEYGPPTPTPEVANMGDLYPTEPPPAQISSIGDVYPGGTPGVTPATLGDVYPDQPPAATVSDMGDVYQAEPTQSVSNMGDVYPDEPPAPSVSDMGDVYQDEATQPVSEIGDVYPDQPPAPSVSDMGDAYPEEPVQASVSEIGDAYPGEEATNETGEMGTVYQKEETPQASDLGAVYQKEEAPQPADMGSVYQKEETPNVSDLGTAYPDKEETPQVGSIGNTYESQT